MKKILTRAFVIFCCLLITFVLWLVIILGPLKSYLPLTFQFTGTLFSSKTYLLLLQNDAEIRPTGGFISTFGELQFAHGIPINLKIMDVFSLKGHQDETYVEPPYPMEKFLAGDTYHGHSFHDANWSPDFPTSADALLAFYKEEFPEKNVDGIITINFALLENILKEIGPVVYESKEITNENLFHTIQYEQNNIDRHNLDDLRDRKSIISELAPIVIKKLLSNPLHYHQISDLLYNSIQNKDITVYSRDTALQNELNARHATNVFPKPLSSQIPFAIVEANLGGMKSDRYITRSYTQDVFYTAPNEKEQESLEVRTTVTLQHNGTSNPPLSHEYRGFFRTYLPQEATVSSLPADVLAYDELGYKVLGQEVRLSPGQTFSFTYAYTLPLTYFQNKQLQVYLYKQSGISNTTYESIIHTPTDYLISSGQYHALENVGVYSTNDLIRDEVLTASIAGDTTPPRVTVQSFLDYNKISIQFNEPVLSYDCSHIPNWEVVDLDKEVPDITNSISIVSIRCSDQEAILQTRNIRTQYGEHFRVTMRNIRDRANNIIVPNPRSVTVVQRFDKDAPNEK